MIKSIQKEKEFFMRKSLFITVALSLCMAEFGAFSAPARRPGGANSARAAQTTNVVNPGVGQKGASAPTVNVQQNNGGAVRGRPGATQNANTNGKAPTQNAGGNGKAPAAIGVRAAATKKAISMGTKVATATENTVVSKDCQNAYYGCMDAFCMLDNASGGRCQCNDKITELDTILEQIMKLDEQSMRIATEGVETVEMGEYADQIKARTKSIEGEFATKEEKKVAAPAQKKSLDLSIFNNSSMFDDDDEDVFDTSNKEEKIKIADDLANKKGDELHKEAAKICTQQLPADCRNSASMLQMTYAQKIRSDCTGYENSLKQKKAESTQKLQTAQKAVREAVLEDVKNKNKYTTEGECVVAFDQCMQTTAKCGADYTGCVADDTVLTMGTDGTKGVATTAQIKTSASAIGVSANTLAMLTDKAPICESVLKQCENVRKGVWASFLKMIAPTLKSAEVSAEQNRRMNCIGTIVDCYKNACAAQWPDQESAEYDMCLSNPEIVGNLCQIQINKCSTGTTGADVMEYVMAKLQALRVDACTTEVKQCLQSENNCGEGYINCIGLDKDIIVKMCTNSATNYKLMACQSKFQNNQYEVQNYVAQVAQGLILNMDNAALAACQEAGKKAMTDFCGSETECKGSKLESALAFNNADSLLGKLRYRFCPMDAKTGKITYKDCKAVAGALTKADYTSDEDVWVPDLEHALNFACFAFNDGTIDVNAESVVDLGEDLTEEERIEKENQALLARQALIASAQPGFYYDCDNDGDTTLKEEADRVADILTRKVKNILGRIETDNTVKQCVMGRDLKGITTYTGDDAGKAFDDMWTMKSTSGVGKGAFPNLMAQYRNIVADAVLGAAAKRYEQEYDNFVSVNEPKAEKELKDRFAAIQKEMDEVERNQSLLIANKTACMMEGVNMTNEFYRMTKHNRKYMQVRIEKGWTHRLLGFARKRTTGVITDTYMRLLKDAAGSDYVPNKYLINVKTTWTDNADKTTGVCNFKIGLYECDNFKAHRTVLGEGIHYCDGTYTKFIKNITTKTAVSDSAVNLN